VVELLADPLTRFALFAGLDAHTRRQIVRDAHRRTYEAGQVIVLAGEPTRAVYLVLDGEVRIERSSLEGREYVLHSLGPGQCFNLASALDGGFNLATVRASTQAITYVLPVDVFRRIVGEHPDLSLVLLQYMAGRVRGLCDTVEDLALHTVRTRLARCLLSYTNGRGHARVTNSRVPASRYMTQGEMAAYIGTVRDVVGRTLRVFSKEGLIRRERGRVVITDLPGLRREALCDEAADVLACRRMN
jgi:CRP/FNR family transcriptional regulator